MEGGKEEQGRDRKRGTSDPHVLSSLCLKWVRLHKVISIFSSTLTSKATAQLVKEPETVRFTSSFKTSSHCYRSVSLDFSLYHLLFYYGDIY